jgi:hypothetical protein
LSLSLAYSAAGIGGFALGVFVCRHPIDDSGAALSTLASVVLVLGTARRSSALADEPDEIDARIPSANKLERAAVALGLVCPAVLCCLT